MEVLSAPDSVDSSVAESLPGCLVLACSTGGSLLLCVTSSGKLLTVKLRSARSLPPMKMETGSQLLTPSSTRLTENCDDFESMMHSLLKKDVNQPIVRCRPDTELSEAEALSLLNESTGRLREQLLKLQRVRREIVCRRELLDRRASLLLSECAEVSTEVASLGGNVEEVACSLRQKLMQVGE